MALRPQFYRCPFHVCLVMALRGHASGTSGLFRVLALAVSGSEATPPWYPRHRPSLAYMVSSAIGLRCEPASGRHRGPDARVGAQDSCAWAPFGPDRGGCDEAVAQACGLRGHRMVRGGAHPDRRRRRVANAGRRFLVPRDPLAQQPSVARLWFNIARTVVLDGSGGLSVSSQSTSVQYTLAGVALVSGDAHALVQCMHARCL